MYRSIAIIIMVRKEIEYFNDFMASNEAGFTPIYKVQLNSTLRITKINMEEGVVHLRDHVGNLYNLSMESFARLTVTPGMPSLRDIRSIEDTRTHPDFMCFFELHRRHFATIDPSMIRLKVLRLVHLINDFTPRISTYERRLIYPSRFYHGAVQYQERKLEAMENPINIEEELRKAVIELRMSGLIEDINPQFAYVTPIFQMTLLS